MFRLQCRGHGWRQGSQGRWPSTASFGVARVTRGGTYQDLFPQLSQGHGELAEGFVHADLKAAPCGHRHVTTRTDGEDAGGRRGAGRQSLVHTPTHARPGS